MTLPPLLRRTLTFGLSAVLMLVCGIAGVLHLQQRALRARAERLLTDIRALESEKSSFDEARMVFRRWSGFREYQGSCSAANCVFALQLADFSNRHLNLFFGKPWLFRIYMFLGGRPTGIYTRVNVQDNLVRYKLFGAAILSPLNPDGRNPRAAYAITAHAEVAKTLTTPAEHKEYEISVPDACLNCVAVLARLTPQASSADISRLWSFDFSCLTRLVPCRSPRDLMPNAWEEFLDERADYCAAHVEHEVRTAEDIGIFELVADTTSACGPGIPCDIAKARLIQRLRGSASFQPKRTYGLNLSAPVQGHKLARGARLIVLFTDLFPEPDNSISPTFCGTMFLNDSNTALLRRNLDEGDARPIFRP